MDPAKVPERYIHKRYGHAWARFAVDGMVYTAEWDEHGSLTVTNRAHHIVPNDHPVVLEARKFYAKINAALERFMRQV